MNDEIKRTVHYTTKSIQICENLIHYIPQDAILVEPFVGDGDLINLFPNNTWEKYDIEYHEGIIQQDTLLNPVDFSNKWVITNPPYLARNKAKDKTIFDLYEVDDLYKASLMTMLNAEGGIVIIPTNFFTDERTGLIRHKFLNRFKINHLNIFTIPMFKSTTYSICSFVFQKKDNKDEKQIIETSIFPSGKTITIELNPLYDYRIAGEEYYSLSNQKQYFGRLLKDGKNKEYITNIKLYALDTRTEKIHLSFEEELFYGKNTDRVYATLTSDKMISEEEQIELIGKFNIWLTNFREKYGNLPLTNYRDYDRKRIGFTFVYQILSAIYDGVI